MKEQNGVIEALVICIGCGCTFVDYYWKDDPDPNPVCSQCAATLEEQYEAE